MPIILDKFALAYFYAPKCACSSVKQFLYAAEQGQPWDKAANGAREVHHYWRHVRGFDKDFVSITDDTYRACENSWSFAIIRDPAKRLMSAYSNRIGYHGEMKRGGLKRRLKAATKGLGLNPDINAFFRNFDAYRALDFSVDHHTRPQTDFVGTELSKLDAVYRIEDMDALAAELRDRTGYSGVMPREQTGGVKYKIEDLDAKSVEALKRITAEEYRHLKDFYSPPW